MLKTIIQIVSSIGLLGWAAVTSAMPITAADTVVVDGREWAQVDLFRDLSWNEINAVCSSAVCDNGGLLNGYEMTGWSWAGLDEVGALFGAFTGHDHINSGFSISESNSTWAPAFLDAFRSTDARTDSAPVFGILNFQTGHPFGSGEGPVSAALWDRYNPAHRDYVELWTVSDADTHQPNHAAWFYRAEVPAPATVPLVFFALAGLYCSRRQRLVGGRR